MPDPETPPTPIVSRRGALSSGWPAAVAAVAVLALVALSGLVRPAPHATGAPPPIVGRSLQVCSFPTETTADVGGATVDELPLALAVPATAGAGRVALAPLEGGEPTDSSETAGDVVAVTQTGPLRLDTEGGFAGASATTLVSATKGADRGDSALACGRPGTHFWFAAVGGGDEQSTRILLTNPDSDDAVVDLHAFGADGEVALPGALNLTVARHSTREVALAGLLPAGLDGPVTVHVSAAAGRVAALAHSIYQVDRARAGADWTVGQPAPGRRLVLPGIPGGAGARELVIGNPGTHRASVDLAVLGADGAFAPAGSDTVEVEPGTTVTVQLDPALGGEAATLELTSSAAIVASVVSRSERKDAAADVAVQQPVAPLLRAGGSGERGSGEHTGLAALVLAEGLSGTLVLANASSTDTDVDVRVHSADGKSLLDRTVAVPARSSVDLRVPSGAGATAVQLSTPGDAVHGALVVARGSGPVAGLTTLAVTSGAASESTVPATMGRGAGW